MSAAVMVPPATASTAGPSPPAATAADSSEGAASHGSPPVTPSPTALTPTDFHLRPGSALSDDEERATHAFLAVVNPWRSARGYEPLPWSSAVKFLMARKFHVERALSLYQQHELMRIREGLAIFDPTQSPLKEELETGIGLLKLELIMDEPFIHFGVAHSFLLTVLSAYLIFNAPMNVVLLHNSLNFGRIPGIYDDY